MLNSKYSKVLTIILIIAIIAIIGLLVYVGIDWYKTSSATASADRFDDEFENWIANNNSEDIDTNVTNTENTNTEENTELIEPVLNLEEGNTQSVGTTTGGSSGGSSSSGKKLTYKGYNVAGRIEIPKTGIKYYVLETVTPNSLNTSVGILYGVGLNKVGNTVIAGHNFRNGTFFSNNKKLAEGDKIYITDLEGKKVTYSISKTYITTDHDAEYFVRDTRGKRAISLTTCTDDSKNRLIIWAEEV